MCKAESESFCFALLLPEILRSHLKCVSKLCAPEQEAYECPVGLSEYLAHVQGSLSPREDT